jgi:Tol biopolymer transport system component
MHMKRAWLVLLVALALTVPSGARAQYFGQNKVQYDKFDWKIINTEHFDVYFYEGERLAAMDAARMAERSYTKLSAILNHEVKEPIPLILYASHSDFQQTNITAGLISEGTGGITESFKRRVMIPFTGSYADLDHVLTHELVHAFQFDILFGDRMGLIANPFAVRIPLWFVEGMAEYLSIGEIDPNTEMWLRDAALEGYLLSIEDLGRVGDIRVYRLGQSVWDYIARTYGQRKIGELLKGAGRSPSLSGLFENVLGASLETVSQGWQEEVRRTYLPQIAEYKKADHYGRRLTDHRKDLSYMNVAPAVSPRGDRFVYISDKSLYNDIYMASTLDGSDLGKLVKGERTAAFESLRFLNTSMSWSPDERFLAFPAKIGPQDALYILDIKTKKVVRKLKFGFDEVLSPTWSPDGERLAFVALVGGQSDLFMVDSDGENLKRLTEDRFAVRHPEWSPDGKRIAFSTDRGPETDFDKLVFGPMVIAIYNLDTGVIDIFPNQQGRNINPQWSPGGDEIAYISDRTGITNIFMTDLKDNETYQLTNVLSGVSGITPESPAMSWSAKGNRMIFCAFSGGGWDIYAINDPQRLKVRYERKIPVESGVFQGPPIAGLSELDTGRVPTRSAPLAAVTSYTYEPPGNEPGGPNRVRLLGLSEYMDPRDVSPQSGGPAVAEGEAPALNALPDTSGFHISNYKLKFTQDLAAGGIGFASNVNVFGQTALAFSDILGNHSIYIVANVFGSLAESDLLFAYFNLAKRTNYGFAVFQQRNDFYIFTAPDTGDYETQIYRGGQVYLWRPFNRFNRLELDLQASSVSSRTYLYGFDNSMTSIPTGKTRYFVSSSVGLVHDNSLFGITGPLAGGRSRLRFEQAVGDIRYSSGLVDYRKYINMRQRYAFATRFVWAGSYGKTPQLFRIGGPFTLRGPDWGELEGTKVGFANFEFRFPLIEQLVLGWPLPLGFRAIRGVLFFDVGGAWYDDSEFQPVTSEGSGPFRLKDTVAGYGFGVRMNLGLFILRYDLTQKTDLSRSLGKSRSYITFGADF